MDINWQHHNPANPADAARGPQAYDDHLYYAYVVTFHEILYLFTTVAATRFGVSYLLTEENKWTRLMIIRELLKPTKSHT